MEKVSFFADFYSMVPSEKTLEDIYQIIRTDARSQSITAAYRSTHDKRIKEGSYTFSVAVVFKGGKGKNHVTEFTGVALVDLDHVALDQLAHVKQLICQDPHTLLCYTTISGEGLRILYRYEMTQEASLEQQAKYYILPFMTGNHYYEQLTHQKADPLCKNATRLSGIAYDPEVYFNPDAIPFKREEIIQQSETVRKENKSEKAQKRIQAYFDNFIKPQLHDEGIVFAHGSHNEFVMRTGYMLADKGYNKNEALKWAKKTFKEYADTETVFKSCFASSPHSSASNRSPIATVQEIEDYLSEHIQLRYNLVLSRVEQKVEEGWKVLLDRELFSLWRKISKTKRANASDVANIVKSDYVKSFHPFSEYLDEVAKDENDGTDYILQLAQTVKVKGGEEEQLLWYQYLKKWMVAMVAGWLEEGDSNNVVLVFIGEQGTNKSTWQRMLLPPELRQYFSVKTNTGRMSKDDRISLCIKGLVCCEELDTMTPSELNQFKSIITMPFIDERAAYGHFHEHKKRYASFCGNGNSAQFLTDTTGNRRWLVFEIEHITSPREHPFPYRGIYAQAYRLYKEGFRYWFSTEEIEKVNLRNKNFEVPHAEQELVATYFRKPTDDEAGEFITASRALQIIGGNITQKLSLAKISQAFVELGFKRKRLRGIRGFIAIERTGEEIKSYLKRCATMPPCHEVL